MLQYVRVSTNKMAFSPRSVLITGANRGIGLGLVEGFLGISPPSAHVLAACRSPETAKELHDLAAKNSNLTVVQLDVGENDSIAHCKNVVEKILGNQGLTLLINNAGKANKLSEDTLLSVTPEKMIDIFKVNTVGTLMVSKAFLPLLERAAEPGTGLSISRAAIVNISSGAGSITENDMGGGYAYRSSKAAQNMITKCLSIDAKPLGILVVALHPGWVQTDMGGPRAKESVSECVEKLLHVMATLDSEDKTGNFYNNSGHLIPW